MEIIFSIMLGIGLAASCGFKVFVPFFIISIANLSGHLELSQSFEWIGTYPALILFGVATLIEIVSYCFPFIDTAVDVISTPVTAVSGVIAVASCVQGMSPMFSWVIAIIVGGTVAGGSKIVNTGVRGATTTVTGGLGNGILNILQTILALFLSILSIFLPILAIIVLIVFIIMAIKLFKKFKNKGFKFQQKESKVSYQEKIKGLKFWKK